MFLQDLVEGRNEGLSKPEREDQLGTGHEELRSKTLEEGSETLLLGHLCDDLATSLLGLKVAVLNTGLDYVERGGNDERCRGTADGGDEVLVPRGRVVVGEVENLLLCEGGTTEEL